MQKKKGAGQSPIAIQPQPSAVYNAYDFHEVPPFVHYLTLILVIVSLGLSAWTFMKIDGIESAAVPETIDANDFLAKLTSHEEARSYVGVAPLNILQINEGNLGNLQSQIAGLDTSYMGSYLVQYTDAIVVYDYESDVIKGKIGLTRQSQDLAQDFEAKLYAHPEMAALLGEQPQGGQLDEATLSTLKQQFPEVYAPAKVGNFLLRYSSVLVIYDYTNDRIVNVVKLQ